MTQPVSSSTSGFSSRPVTDRLSGAQATSCLQVGLIGNALAHTSGAWRMHKDQVRLGSLRRADFFTNSSRSILQPLYRPHILRHTWNEEGYAMTLWGDRFRTHTLWTELERARQAVNEMKIDAQDGPGQQMLAYVGAVVELLE